MCRLLVTLALTVFVLTIFESASIHIRNDVKRPRMTPDKKTGNRVAHWKKEVRVNPEELGNYWENDIMLVEYYRDYHVENIEVHYWPDGIIPITISGDFNKYEQGLIIDAIKTIERNTCVKFAHAVDIPVPESDWKNRLDYINITSKETGCWCKGIGKSGGEQQVNLQTPGCTWTHTIIHELLHAIGLDHEHVRVDRDFHVWINSRNIREDMGHNFNKYISTADFFGLPYDYDSIMHYSPYAFAKDPNFRTIFTNVPDAPIGQAKTLSKLDILKINMMYNCSEYLSKEDIDKLNNWRNNPFAY